jgi:sarcosine oxidase subunit alpha
MRLGAQPHERIDRSQEIRFYYEGQAVRGLEGDTIGSALFAAGRRVFSRSFKYHRPRGLLCCTGHCPNCLMTVDGSRTFVCARRRSLRERSSRA